MKVHSLAALIAGFALATSVNAVQNPVHAVEDSHEFDGSMVSLPSGAEGRLVFSCNGCALLSLSITPTTPYYIGRQEVTLADVRKQILTNPTGCVLIATPRGKTNITRLTACASVAPARK